MASQGPNNGGTFASVSTAAGQSVWSNPSNAQVSDNIYTVATFAFATDDSEELKVTNFGFSIPAGATIGGVTVEIERKRTGGGATKDKVVKLIKGGTVSGTNKADLALTWPTSDTFKTYGGSSDLWGLSLSPADINASNFGVMLQGNSGTIAPKTGENMYVDNIRVTITYTTGSARSFATVITTLITKNKIVKPV